jgi:hypothetical protein
MTFSHAPPGLIDRALDKGCHAIDVLPDGCSSESLSSRSSPASPMTVALAFFSVLAVAFPFALDPAATVPNLLLVATEQGRVAFIALRMTIRTVILVIVPVPIPPAAIAITVFRAAIDRRKPGCSRLEAVLRRRRPPSSLISSRRSLGRERRQRRAASLSLFWSGAPWPARPLPGPSAELCEKVRQLANGHPA